MLRFFVESGYFAEEPIYVQIDARMTDGYPPHREHGSEWKERMMLRDFLSRIFTRLQEIDIEERRIRTAFRERNHNMLEQACQVYEGLYKKTLRTEMSNRDYHDRYRGSIDPFDHKSNYQRDFERQMLMQQTQARHPGQFAAILQPDPAVEKAKKEAFLRADKEEKEKKESEDIYYLLTGPDKQV